MKWKITNQLGFTLVEMTIVLLIISILLFILIPNMTKNNQVVGDKSCEATTRLIQSQIGAYEIENGEQPTSIEDIAPYIEGEIVIDDDQESYFECPNGTRLTVNEDGEIEEKDASDNDS